MIDDLELKELLELCEAMPSKEWKVRAIDDDIIVQERKSHYNVCVMDYSARKGEDAQLGNYIAAFDPKKMRELLRELMELRKEIEIERSSARSTRRSCYMLAEALGLACQRCNGSRDCPGNDEPDCPQSCRKRAADNWIDWSMLDCGFPGRVKLVSVKELVMLLSLWNKRKYEDEPIAVREDYAGYGCLTLKLDGGRLELLDDLKKKCCS